MSNIRTVALQGRTCGHCFAVESVLDAEGVAEEGDGAKGLKGGW